MTVTELVTLDERRNMREHAENNVHYGDGEDPRNVLTLLDALASAEEALASRVGATEDRLLTLITEHWLSIDERGCRCGWRTDPPQGTTHLAHYREHLARVLANGE